ncbi:MAG TPA: helical backbone metal receptor [Burkholderiaceae bacterium]|nr:helical backbone metal receptor [Burkholderiaceae bacterium]
MTDPRIASLVPSATELLVALGLTPWLVARTGWCTHPAGALSGVPKVGGTKDVNLTKLRRLGPTHVVVNVDENRLETVQALREFVPSVIVTHPNAPEEVPALIEQLRAAFAPRADAATTRLQAELAAELDATRPASFVPTTVLYLIWREPWMTVARDTYIARLLARAGFVTLPAVEGGLAGAARYPRLVGDESWLADVDEVWLASEPYAFGTAHEREAQALCPRARVRLVDGRALSWHGASTAAGLRTLRALRAT